MKTHGRRGKIQIKERGVIDGWFMVFVSKNGRAVRVENAIPALVKQYPSVPVDAWKFHRSDHSGEAACEEKWLK